MPATILSAQPVQALLVDLGGNRHGALHVKLKEMGFAQVAAHDSLEESKESCDRFAGPTLILFFLGPEGKPFNYVRFYQKGAQKPVEVAIVATAHAGETLRQEFLKLNVAAFARSEEPAVVVGELARVLSDTTRYFRPVAAAPAPKPSAASAENSSETSSFTRRREQHGTPQPAQPAAPVPPPASPRPAAPKARASVEKRRRRAATGERVWPLSWVIGAVATLAAGAAAGVGIHFMRGSADGPAGNGVEIVAPASRPGSAPEATLAPTPAAANSGSRGSGAGFDPFLALGSARTPAPLGGATAAPSPPPPSGGGVFTFESLGQMREMEASKLLGKGEIVARGVVSFGGGGFVRSRNQFFIQDEGGAVSLDDAGFRGGVLPKEGDLVEVRGTFEVFRGNLQIEVTGVTKVLSKGHPVVATTLEPRQFSDKVEGRLVRLENVRVTSGNLPRRAGDEAYLKVVTPSGQYAEVYVAKETRIYGQTPREPFAIQGILMQWASGNGGSNFSWYVQPRRLEDIVRSAP